jgi:Tfp pilus assembly protein PilV
LIIEVIVSALLVGMLAIGIFSALDAASARTGAIKSRAIAANVAQADLERLRAMSLTDVSNRRDIYTKAVDGVPFVVTSRADWVTDSSGTATCSTATTKADYLKISAKVTWPAMGGLKPVVLTSVIAPPSGSFASNQGSLAVKVVDAAGNPVVGRSVTLTGPASFSEVTNELGCVLWGFLTAGSGYTVTLGGGCADKNGNDPVTQSVSVVGEAITTITLDCGVPGAIAAVGDTVTRNLSNVLQPAKASPLRYLTVANSGIPAGWKAFGNGTPVAQLTATSLFPFPDPYSVYAGNCQRAAPNSSPNTGTAVMQTAPAGGTAGPVTVRQPAISVDVDRSDTSAQLSGATVTATVDSVLTPGCAGMYTFTTNANGQIDDPGLPYGTYDLCAHSNYSGTIRRIRVADVPNTAPTGTALTRLTVPATTGAGSCP